MNEIVKGVTIDRFTYLSRDFFSLVSSDSLS